MGAHRRPSNAARTARNVALTGAATGGFFVLTATAASASTVEDFERLADCETGDVSKLGYQAQWDYNGPSGFDGGLQFSPATWTSITRGEGLPQYAWQAGKDDQIRMADKLLQQVARERGSVEAAWASQFPACSAKQGLRGVQPGLQQVPAPAPPVEPPTDPVPAQPQPTPGNGASTDPIPAQQSLTILVEQGDWLSTIARDKLELCPPGSDIRECWKPLYEQNRHVVGPNPDAIRPGMTLTYVGGLALPGGGPVEVVEPPAEGGDPDVVEEAKAPAVAQPPSPPEVVEEAAEEAPGGGDYARPVAGVPSRTNFGAPRAGGSRSHQGLDFDCARGDRINAATDGIVTLSGQQGGYGNVVYVVAPDGTETRYAHLDRRDVARDDVVVAGQQVGSCGVTGNVVAGPNGDGSHLHFEVRPGGGAAIDPLPWLRERGLA